MYKLYNVRRWGSLAPHLLLEELGVPYENVWMTPEQVRSLDFRRISPLGYIPALGLADGSSLFESAAIVTFLTASHPEKGLAPAPGTAEQGLYLAWLAFMSANLYPAINLVFHGEAYAADAAARAHLTAAATAESQRLFGILEARLGAEGPWLLGERFTAADIYLFMLTLWAKPSEADLLTRCPAIAAHAAAVRGRPRLRAALEAHGVVTPAAS